MNNVSQFWDLSKPKMCRHFLKNLRIGPEGAKIEFLQTEDGGKISIDEATDEQILQVANDIAEAMEMAKQGKQ